MAFTTEAEVRLLFSFNEDEVPAPLVARCIDAAHDEIRRLLDPRHDDGVPPGPLILGETLLAGAAVCRALAAGDAQDQKRLTLGPARIHEGARFRSLTEVAETSVERAWFYLEPYLLDRPALRPVQATDTRPVLGAP